MRTAIRRPRLNAIMTAIAYAAGYRSIPIGAYKLKGRKLPASRVRRSYYVRHQGAQEKARRVRQLAAGIIRP